MAKIPAILKVAARNSTLLDIFRTSSGDWEIGRVDGKFLNLLSETLGFRYQLVFAPDEEWGRISDLGLWTGMLGLIANGEADIGVCFLTITGDRQKVVDFSIPYWETSLTFATNLPELLPREYLFLYPFDVWTWLCLLAVLFYLPLVLHKVYNTKTSYWGVLLKTWGNIVRQPQSDRAFHGRFLVVLLWTLFSVVSLYYSAVVLSFLTVPLRETPIKTVDELLKATKRGEYAILILNDNSDLETMQKSYNPQVREIAEIVVKNGWYLQRHKYYSHALYDFNEFKRKQAVFADRVGWTFLHGSKPFSNKYVSDQNIAWDTIGIAFKKKFPHQAEFNAVIKRIREAGLYEKFMREEVYKSWITFHQADAYAGVHDTVLIGDISGALYVLLFGYILSFLALILEIVISKKGFTQLSNRKSDKSLRILKYKPRVYNDENSVAGTT